ncbi:MAG: hypothetical protein K1000chlam2_00463 [Chlamydiae bacterium]|nr:hypothetical protein [Chlamydiota bacterium]
MDRIFLVISIGAEDVNADAGDFPLEEELGALVRKSRIVSISLGIDIAVEIGGVSALLPAGIGHDEAFGGDFSMDFLELSDMVDSEEEVGMSPLGHVDDI